MSIMRYFSIYHAVLALSVVLAYLTGEIGIVHAWLGYGVAAVLMLRLIAAFAGMPQLGLMRFYPHFEGLKLENVFAHPAISRSLLAGIAMCLIGVTGTGIAIDSGRALTLSQVQFVDPVYADEDVDRKGSAYEPGETEEDQPLGDLHKALADFLMLLVGAHVTYLYLFKRPLAHFMLFIGTPPSQKK